MLSPEELLKPRFKVIADYPHSPYKIGDVIDFGDGYSTKKMTETPYDDPWGETNYASNHYDEYEFRKYSALFQPLAWWEERKPEDMPEYVKVIEYDRRFFVYHSDEDPIPEDYPKLNTVLKLGQDFQWIMTDKIPYAVLICEQGYELFADTLAPATPEEYLTYKNKNNG